MHSPRDSAAAPVSEAETTCTDPVASLKEMFVDLVMGRRIARGQLPVLRPVFQKQHGIVLGYFVRDAGIDAAMAVGVFAHERLPLVARFSSDAPYSRPDKRSTLGLAVKLIGIPGTKLLHHDATTCDFVFQNHPVFFVDNAQEMCAFTHAGVVQGDYSRYLDTHPTTVRILDEMTKDVASLLTSEYWGLLPHKLGNERVVKYSTRPDPQTNVTNLVDPNIHNYLYLDLKSRLLHGDISFGLYIQVGTNDETMPIDQATVPWDEASSPPIRVGTFFFPSQNIDAERQNELGDSLSFNIWQTLPEHEPLGSIAMARKVAYQAASELRRERNELSTIEPTTLPAIGAPSMADTTIVRAEIHPAIGVARVGNSRDEYFLGPEVNYPESQPPGSFRDPTGALKRQAQRFRLYGFNAEGQVVAELTAANAAIEWKVHVANKKAAWYNFTLAMDIDAVSAPQVEPARRRNSHIAGVDRQKLSIDPGPRTIHGRSTSGSAYYFDSGKFHDSTVYLGELQTDEEGRLIFLGGRGVSQSIHAAPPYDFANNDGWYDDIADGPVSAKVVIAGREIPVESAWVIVAPPNYGPELKSVRTIFDLLEDLSGVAGTVSFTKHILPIFERLCGLQWVNEGFAAEFGWQAGSHFLNTKLLQRLAAPKDVAGKTENDELRRQIFNHFRNYESNNGWVGLWPWIYGDAMDVENARERNATLSKLQYERLRKWADGDFLSDYQPGNTPPGKLECVPLSEQPAVLTEAAIAFCLADAFHPGCELTWAIRQGFSYRNRAKFRLQDRPVNLPEQDYGDVLDPRVAKAYDGPLRAFGPGDVTRWMALPWQTDTVSCRAGYSGNRFTPRTPSFWPARVPNQVLTKADYDVVMDRNRSLPDRQAAFRNRRDWFLRIGRNYAEQFPRMVTEFAMLGIVERFPGPSDADFPSHIFVESFEKPATIPSAPIEPTTSSEVGAAGFGQVASLSDASVLQRGEFTATEGAEADLIPKATRYMRNQP